MPQPARLAASAAARPALRPVRFKAESVAEDGTFSGYGNVFNVVDTYGDIVLPGAFKASLEKRMASGRMPKMLLQHDPARPIGTWLEMHEDATGLYCKGQLCLDVQDGRETHALMKIGALDALSIGGDVVDPVMVAPDQVADYGVEMDASEYHPNSKFRLVPMWDLWEVSVVTFQANEPSLIDAVKRRAPTPSGFTGQDLADLRRAVARRSALLSAIERRLKF